MFSVAELRRFGLSKQGVVRRERAGHLHRLYRGVYALGFELDAPEARYLAAVKAAGDAVLSHRAGGWLWGFLEGDEPRPEVTVNGQGKRAIPGVTVHRSLILDPRDRTRRRGVPITTAARTIIDLAALLDEKSLRHAVRRAQGLRRVSLPLLIRTMDLLLAAGFEHPDVNKPLILSGRRVVPDFRWPKQRLIVEADGAAWHEPTLDAERQALLEAHGERVVRVTWNQAVVHPQSTAARVAAAGSPRTDRILTSARPPLRRLG